MVDPLLAVVDEPCRGRSCTGLHRQTIRGGLSHAEFVAAAVLCHMTDLRTCVHTPAPL